MKIFEVCFKNDNEARVNYYNVQFIQIYNMQTEKIMQNIQKYVNKILSIRLIDRHLTIKYFHKII